MPALRWWWHFGLTPAGKLMVLGWAVGTMLAAGTLDSPVRYLVCLWTAPPVIAFIVGYALRPRAALYMTHLETVTANTPCTIAATVTNTGRRPIYDAGAGLFGLPPEIQDGRSDLHESVLQPGDATPLTVTLEPGRRGVYRMPPLRAYSLFPLGFFRVPAGELRTPPLLVLPAFRPAQGIRIPLGARYQPGGIVLTSQVGESPEYIGNRPYRPGDPVNRLDFRAWARTAHPVVREFEEEFYSRIGLVLDTCTTMRRRPARSGFPDLEAAVSLSATIADTLCMEEHIIDLFAAGPTLHVFRAGRSIAHFDNIMEILAGIEACHTNPFEVIAPAITEELASISAVVAVLLQWDDDRARLLEAAMEAGCSLKVFVIQDAKHEGDLSGLYALTDDVTVFSPADVQKGGFEVL